MQPIAWPVPQAFVDAKVGAAQVAWARALPQQAASLAERWQLVPDGVAWHGWVGVAWPALDAERRPVVLKISWDEDGSRWAGAALEAWQGRGTVRCRAHDTDQVACVVDRLDATRDLTAVTIDEAVEVIAGLLAHTTSVAAPAWAPPVSAMTARMTRELRQATGLDARQRDAALETLRWLGGPLDAPVLLHNDMHFLNVLRTLDGSGWAAIDPMPMAGPPEMELTPMLRNRFEDAAATGDADRALRRRVDQVCAVTGMDAALARRVAQAIALATWNWLQGDLAHMHAPAYQVMSGWLD